MTVGDSGLEFASPEVARAWPYIKRSVDGIVACCQSVSGEQLHWRPPPADSNSLAALATHAFGNRDNRLLGLLCGEQRDRDRQAEFDAGSLTAGELATRWATLRRRLAAALANLSSADIDRIIQHLERGPITGHDVLIIAARHMAEHAGQAALTRDLCKARETN